MGSRGVDALGRFSLLILLFGLGCDAFPLGDHCVYNGRSYPRNHSFPSDDGCNICSCSGNGVACTLRACLPDGGGPPDTADPTDTDIRCTVGSASYPVGALFPSNDGCNDCSCTSSGQVTCTARACLGSCLLSLFYVYRFHDDGGFRAFADQSTLTPPHTHLLARDHLTNALPNQCSRELVCNDPTLVDVNEIRAALAHPDVVDALAQTTRPFYGTDTRPVDGTVFMFDRDDQRGFDVGSGTVPAGLRALVDLLHRLEAQTAATPACSGL